jgi:pilus assembly protein CpaC
MNWTALMRLACRIGAFAALIGTVPEAATASSSTTLSVRMAVKPGPLVFGAVPVSAKATPIPATGKESPQASASKDSLSNSGTSPVTSKAIYSPVVKKPVNRLASVRIRQKATPAPVAAMASAEPSSYLVPEGESKVYRFARPVKRIAIANSEIADYIIINPYELYLLGKKAGTTNLVIWYQNGNSTSAPVNVNRNTKPLEVLLKLALPQEKDIHIYSLGQALVLAGSVSDVLAAETAYRLVIGYSGGTPLAFTPEAIFTSSGSEQDTKENADKKSAEDSGNGFSKGAGKDSKADAGTGSMATADPTKETRVVATGVKGPGFVNLLKIRDPQQVRLEVHIAEVSRSYIENLGLGFFKGRGSNGGGLMTGFVSNATLNLLLNTAWDPNTEEYVHNNLQVEAERKKSLIKILAEPTIVAMSGQVGEFIVGGKFYTSTVAANGAIDYVERKYGVHLIFFPTVLDGGRISLKLASEISEPNTQPVTAGTTFNLPALKFNAASTTVQMNEGENLVIGDLLKDNITNNITSVPLLGDLPLLGTLFRRTEKTVEKKELLIVVRPTLVKASATLPELPTDKFVPADRLIPAASNELFIGDKPEGSRK